MVQGCRAAAAASVWPAGRGGGYLARCCEEGSAWRGAAERAKAVGPACRLGRVAAICALWARPVHARDVFDTMPEHARGRGRGWQLTDPG